MSHPMLHHRATTAPQLTEAEARALAVLATGKTADAAARELAISDRTVRRRVRDVCDRIGADTTIEAIVWAARRHLI